MQTNSTITKGEKFRLFMKKYLYFICLGVALIAFSVTLVITMAAQSNPVQNKPEPGPSAVAVLPMKDATIAMGYSATVHQYNATLNEWAIHKAIDFKATGENVDVYSILAGKVVAVKTDRAFGTSVSIEHENGYISVYKSLDNTVTLKINDVVKQGDIIGKASATSKNEELTGVHLHFELMKGTSLVDPALLLKLN